MDFEHLHAVSAVKSFIIDTILADKAEIVGSPVAASAVAAQTGNEGDGSSTPPPPVPPPPPGLPIDGAIPVALAAGNS